MTEPIPAPTPLAVELRCKKRTCRAVLARVVGASLVCLDGTRVGPIARGMVLERRCPRCGTRNVKWLEAAA